MLFSDRSWMVGYSSLISDNFRVARDSGAIPKDALLVHLRPSHFTLKPSRCALPRKVEAEARRVLRTS
jgi:hypothetical protein